MGEETKEMTTLSENVIISTPPHVKSHRTTRKIMIDVLIALLPCAVMGIVFFGVAAFVIEITSLLTAVAFEFIYYFIWKGGFKAKCKNAGAVCKAWWRQFDFTSAVTGLILALIVPATVKWYEVMIGAAFAIMIVKMVFGGTGKNLVNPAATARVFLLLCFSSMGGLVTCSINAIGANTAGITTSASVMSGILSGDETVSYSLIDLFLGTGMNGSIGETCKVAIIVGGLYLIIRKVIKWWQPVLFLGVTYFFTICFCGFNSEGFMDASALMLSGGLMFGAVFMATDYCTSPKSRLGQIIYYCLLGLLTAVLRYFTQVEVVSFVIMICNILTHLIDRYCIRKPFGYVKEKKPKKEKVKKEVEAKKEEAAQQ